MYGASIFLRDQPLRNICGRYFPETVDYEWGVKYAEIGIPGRRNPAFQWLYGSAKTVKIVLRFDDEKRKGVIGSTCSTVLNWLEANVPPFNPGNALGGQQTLRVRPIYTLVLFPAKNPILGDVTGAYASDVLIKSASGKVLEWRRQEPSRFEVSFDMVRYEKLVYASEFTRTINPIDDEDTPNPEGAMEGAPDTRVQLGVDGRAVFNISPWTRQMMLKASYVGRVWSRIGKSASD